MEEADDKISKALGPKTHRTIEKVSVKDEDGKILKKQKPNPEIPQMNDEKNINKVQGKQHKRIKKKKLDPEVVEFRRKIHQCCKYDDLHSAIEAYRKLVSSSSSLTTPADGENETENLENLRRLIEPQSFHNILSLCDGFSDRPVHVGTPRKASKKNNQNKNNKKDAISDEGTSREKVAVSIENRRDFADEIQKHMNALSVPLNETSFTSLLRLYTTKTPYDLYRAEEILSKAENSIYSSSSPSSSTTSTQESDVNSKTNLKNKSNLIFIPKLRMYSSLLTAYCSTGNLRGALKIWERLCAMKRHLHEFYKNSQSYSAKDSQTLDLSEKEYCALLQCATKNKNKNIFSEILNQLADVILVPSNETTIAICDWFRNKIKEIEENKDIMLSDFNLSLNTDVADIMEKSIPCSGCEISDSCPVDLRTGIIKSGCMANSQLLPLKISPRACISLLKMNETIVSQGSLEEHKHVTFQGGRKGKKRFNSFSQEKLDSLMEQRKKHWQEFKDWLHNVVGPPKHPYENNEDKNETEEFANTTKKPFDFVIDGANVGYYQTNFAGAASHVDYLQIDWLIQHLMAIKEGQASILLVMHERHFLSHVVPDWAKPIVQKWKDSKILYQVPRGCNDDWFWYHAALWCTNCSSSSTISTSSKSSDTMVITNDEMRDHHFQMLAAGYFLRWKDRHQIHFSFGDWTDGKKREVLLTYPEIYSRRIQRIIIPSEHQSNSNKKYGIVIPLPKSGDKNRYLDEEKITTASCAIQTENYVCIELK